MILIISEEKDNSTSKVIEWLIYYNAPFIRINDEDEIEVLELTIDRFTIKVKGRIITSGSITGFWYRRGKLHMKYGVPGTRENTLSGFVRHVEKHMHMEYDYALDSIYYILNGIKRSIGGRHALVVNKLIVLSLARSIGLLIPDTGLFTTKDRLKAYTIARPDIITKPINTPFSFFTNIAISTYTEPVRLDNVPVNFPLSLFQERIEKQFELRVFYLGGKMYTMAIFSQADPQTRVDFRVYNNVRPNRNVPYKLPTVIEDKIHNLMQRLQLNTGSLDLIKDTKGRYIFLEVNPVGQFGMVSAPCNYNLEREIARKLTGHINDIV